jgi:hypothetical protein
MLNILLVDLRIEGGKLEPSACPSETAFSNLLVQRRLKSANRHTDAANDPEF